MPDGSNLVIGQANTGTSTTSLTRSGGRPVTALSVNNEWAIAISAGSRGPAISADSEADISITGHSRDGVGVMGASDRDVGLLGTSDGQGPAVFGRASGSAGIVGTTTLNDSAGVVGSASGDSAGVWGKTASAKWPGVEGFATGTNHGVRGISIGPASPSSVGVVGWSKNGHGVVGAALSAGSFGGLFFGGLTVVSGPKSAAVPHPDGSYRTLYCMESPESWFEDFGRAKLVRGRARIKLDRNFAAVVRTNDYHVFLSPEGETRGLYVSRRSSAGFEVREHEAAKNSAKFSYRVVARRKDIEAPRFAKITKPLFDGRDLKKIPQGIDLRKFEKRMKAARPSSGRV
jgi:hypothetical protein